MVALYEVRIKNEHVSSFSKLFFSSHYIPFPDVCMDIINTHGYVHIYFGRKVPRSRSTIM